MSTQTFIRTVVHMTDMACVIEPGDSTSQRWDAVTCASCIVCMPQTIGRCAHEGIFPMQRVHDSLARPTAAYMWACPCGHRRNAARENVPARWLMSGDNHDRLARIDTRVVTTQVRRAVQRTL